MTLSAVAGKYIGQTEKKGNMGFIDADFERKMVAVGFVLKYAWCCYFAELCCKETFTLLFNELEKLFSGSVLATQNNIKKMVKEGCDWLEIIDGPEADCLIFYTTYEEGKPSAKWTGHISICKSINEQDKDMYVDISGNTNKAGGREGIMVLDKPHRTSVVKSLNDGLRMTLCVRIKQAV